MKANDLINKTDECLKKLFARHSINEPYYTMLRELQQDIYKYKNRKVFAEKLRGQGKTIREIAKEMGYKHPGFITNLLKLKTSSPIEKTQCGVGKKIA